MGAVAHHAGVLVESERAIIAGVVRLADRYAAAVTELGLQPVLFPMAEAEDIACLLPLVDGVLLTGSPSNVEATHFGATALPTDLLDPRRDKLTMRLVREALGRRFALYQHPRLAAILSGSGPVCFPQDASLPDPYDGLLEACAGEPLPVHDCMGITLHLEGQPWGVLIAKDAARQPDACGA